MSGKFALIIANTEYNDSGLAQLSAPGKDAEDFANVLKSPEVCDFDDVKVLLNQPSSSVIEAMDEFFDQKKPNDLLILYFSGHGIRDEFGSLFLAVKNTARNRLKSTAIKSDYVRDLMDQSRSKRQVLILDCCNSGAFAQGTKSATGTTMGTALAFEGNGYGHVVLTASDSTQFAWEGDKIIGETSNSLFTHFLIKGLAGEADPDHDGVITVDKLYDYVYEQVVAVTPKQTPGKWSYKEQGEMILRKYNSLEAPTSETGKLRRKLFEQAKFYQTQHAKLMQEKEGLETMALAAEKTKNEPDLPASKKKSASNLFALTLGGIFGALLIFALCVTAAFAIAGKLKPVATSELTENPGAIELFAVVTETPIAADAPTKKIPDLDPAENVIDMRFVPAGEFTMGSNAEDAYAKCAESSSDPSEQCWFEDERPPHVLSLDAFYIDTYEVTNILYSSCVESGVCKAPKDTSSATRNSYYGNPLYENYPVIFVDWDMAKTYCEWRGASLPTEAQWEKAARGADGRTYAWGEEVNCDWGNFSYCAGGDTNEVGNYDVSPYGAYDMTGNVWEWVADWYDDAYYANSPSFNPQGPSVSPNAQRVVRGGSWNDVDYILRASYRNEFEPEKISDSIGFRCASSP